MVQYRTFYQRFGHQGICVLPDSVLSDDPLIDPDTSEELPSLRDRVSLVNGMYFRILCYARVLRTCGDDLYWADIAATPDFVNPHRAILTEEDLSFALPYDVRVQEKSPAQILKMMAAHAREVRPVQGVAPVVTPEPFPVPVMPLEPLAVVEVSNDELQEAIGPMTMDTNNDTNRRRVSRPIGSFRMQQAFLRVIIDALMTQLYCSQLMHESVRSSAIRAQCAIVSSLQRWQRHSRQRCVNAIPVWSDGHSTVMWQLTVGNPFAARVAA
jgi:hypothetical protein